MLANLGAGLGGEDGEPAHPARRLQRRVAGVEERRGESTVHRLVDPFGGEAVGAQRLVLDRERVALVGVVGEAEAACAPARIFGERGEAVERLLGHPPVASGLLTTDRLDRDVVRRRAATEGEAAVASARPAGDLARFMEANPQASLGERERSRTARHTATDHGDVRRAVDPAVRDRRRRLVEPVARQRRSESTCGSGT